MDCQLASSEVLKINLHPNETLLYPPALISNSHFIYLFIFLLQLSFSVCFVEFYFQICFGAHFYGCICEITWTNYNE